MKFLLILTLIATALFSGCVNLKPQPDQVTLYTLGLNVRDTTVPAQGLPSVYIARPELSGYLAGSAMRYHTDAGEIGSLNDARWGEDLGEGIARALGEYVQATGKVSVRSQYPWPKLARDDLSIRVLFKRFEANQSGQIKVGAIWQIRNAKEAIKEGYFQLNDLTWEVGSPSSYVAQLNKVLDLLAQEIAQAI